MPGTALPGGPIMTQARKASRGIGLGDAMKWVRDKLPDMPGIADQMAASSQRFRDVAGTQGLAAAMRDPVHEELATNVAGAFDMTGGIGLGGMAGIIRAYHGSPHTFDKFDMSKLGSGEGAQAYGHGLYFAENPKVAEQYQEQLSKPSYTKDGAAVNENTVGSDISFAAQNAMPELSFSKANDITNQLMHAVDNGKSLDEFADIHGDGPNWPAWEAGIAAAKRLNRSGGGSHYTVDLDVNHEDLLDWDAPLSQQPEKVRQALEGLGAKRWLPESDNEMARSMQRSQEKYHDRGSIYYSQFEKAHGGQAGASAALREAGIPGIRYLDGGSRGDGEGTRNFVLFDDQLAQIKERNGQPVAPPPLDMSQEARMARAKEQGFTVDAYKGMHPYDYRTSEYNTRTGEMIKAGPEVTEIQRPSGGYAGFLSSDPGVASRFAMALDRNGGAVYPTKLRFDNPVEIAAGGKPAAAFQFDSIAKEHGTADDMGRFKGAFEDPKVDGIILRNTKDEGDVYVPRTPQQIRSVHAAFDPAQRDSAALLANMAGAGLVGAGLYGAYEDEQRGIGLGR